MNSYHPKNSKLSLPDKGEPRRTAEPTCTIAKKCSGCQLSNMSYDRQLDYKQAQAVKLLRRYGHVDKIIGMANPYHYRNKATAAVRRTASGKIISGVYSSATGGLTSTDSCFLNDIVANKIIASARGLVAQLHIPVYNPTGGNGYVRHFMVRHSRVTNEYMFTIVCAKDNPPNIDKFAKKLIALHNEVKTVVLCVSNSRKQTVGTVARILHGNGYIQDILCGKHFRISPQSFYQVNPAQTQVLYDTAADFAALTGKERVLDAYCGIGTIALSVSDSAREVVGVELNDAAVKDALVNADLNNASNVRFIAEDAADYIQRAAENGEHFDTVFLDPPRAGCSRRFLLSLGNLAPETVVYISCNPQTLARDLYFIVKNGYKVRKLQPVDMFPWTKHIETVCLLSKSNAKEHI